MAPSLYTVKAASLIACSNYRITCPSALKKEATGTSQDAIFMPKCFPKAGIARAVEIKWNMATVYTDRKSCEKWRVSKGWHKLQLKFT
jgi:hypothetical protein